MTLARGVAASDDNPLVECADIQVPLCHPGVCTSTLQITVFVKRIPPQKLPPIGSKQQALWMLQGGPGESSSVAVYTMDHRGTGRSAPLSCAEDNIPYSPNTTLKCLTNIKTKYGAVAPAAFSVTSAASDLAYIITNEQSTNDVFVYGLSYGTYLVERLMHLAPEGVKGYILDSVQSEQFYITKDAPYYSNWDRDVGGTVDTFLSYCDNDKFCASKVGPKSKTYIQGLYARLDKKSATASSKCADVIRSMLPEYATNPSWLVNNFLYTMLRDYNKRNLIPAYLYRLNRCNSADQAVVANMVMILTNSTENLLMTTLDGFPKSLLNVSGTGNVSKVSTLTGEGRSNVVYKAIVLSEIWELPSPSAAQMTKWFESAMMGAMNPLEQRENVLDNCIYLGGKDTPCKNYAVAYDSGFTYARDAYWNKTAAIPAGSSVLMFTGYLDPATPPKYAKDEFATMAGTTKKLIEFPYAPHVIVGQSPTDGGVDCGGAILASFLAAKGDVTLVKDACVANVLKMNFTTVLDSKFAAALFGTDVDVYGPGAAGPNPALEAPASGPTTAPGGANPSGPQSTASLITTLPGLALGLLAIAAAAASSSV
ncbi:hypothetical protein DYB34_004410 [Aphanomyces astaci]|uniref:AB hydrolase-1 domain-containing protein n=2 Tax=Aphanomyces astaci TaxID=112090 RepID=A0A397G0M3_APHAT|nr:hypothetical protein DYB34_004410 [Aphanomyces astaci]RHZ38869.1 hypothetical protein DYB31_010110 [Aphanomyces astaci]